MSHARVLLLTPLLVVFVVTSGCVCPPWICGWDGDDPFDDDDREDDDDAIDDDDAVDGDVLDALTFAMTFRATPAPGDDDDSAPGDDDDSARDTRDGVTDVQGTLVTRYWSDHEARTVLCEQHVAFDAEARFEGAPDCGGCTGFLQLRASSVVDVSNPLIDADHCDPAEAVERGLDYGRRLLTPAGVGGLGDFLSIALVDAERGLDEGLVFAPTDGLSYAEQAEALAGSGAVLTHGGYLRATPGGMVVGAGIDQVAGTPDDDAAWFAFWRFFRTPGSNPYEGLAMDGLYSAQSVWVVFPR
jgi:hypothetical protein